MSNAIAWLNYTILFENNLRYYLFYLLNDNNKFEEEKSNALHVLLYNAKRFSTENPNNQIENVKKNVQLYKHATLRLT